MFCATAIVFQAAASNVEWMRGVQPDEAVYSQIVKVTEHICIQREDLQTSFVIEKTKYNTSSASGSTSLDLCVMRRAKGLRVWRLRLL